MEVLEELDESCACNKLLVPWKFQHMASQLSLILVVNAVGGTEKSHGVTLCCSMEKHREGLEKLLQGKAFIHKHMTSSAARPKCHREMQSL